MKKTTFLLALILSTTANANLLTNGDFETSQSGADATQIVPGWTLTGSVLQVGNFNRFGFAGSTFWFGAGSPAQDGSYAIAFNAGQDSALGSVFQTFATTAGERYRLSYDFGTTLSGDQRMLVEVLGNDGSTILANRTDHSVTPDAQLLAAYTLNFIANGSTTTLRFSDVISNPTTNQDGVLDNVVVTDMGPSVPEPAPFALAALGLALARRKRKPV